MAVALTVLELTGLAALSSPHRRRARRGVTWPYKYSREVNFVDELPKTVSGKIRRSELRERLRQGLAE